MKDTMQLKEIYRPIAKELGAVEELLKTCLENTSYHSVSEISIYLLNPRSKQLRPALLLLAAKTSDRAGKGAAGPSFTHDLSLSVSTLTCKWLLYYNILYLLKIRSSEDVEISL